MINTRASHLDRLVRIGWQQKVPPAAGPRRQGVGPRRGADAAGGRGEDRAAGGGGRRVEGQGPDYRVDLAVIDLRFDQSLVIVILLLSLSLLILHKYNHYYYYYY
jgi:hypothetical protein